MRKVKEFWELIDVLKAQGYEWEVNGLINRDVTPSFFSLKMFGSCGDYYDGYSWHDDWLQPEENKDVGKFCKFWDNDEEPANDSRDTTYGYLTSFDRHAMRNDRYPYKYYRVVGVDIK